MVLREIVFCPDQYLLRLRALTCGVLGRVFAWGHWRVEEVERRFVASSDRM